MSRRRATYPQHLHSNRAAAGLFRLGALALIARFFRGGAFRPQFVRSIRRLVVCVRPCRSVLFALFRPAARRRGACRGIRRCRWRAASPTRSSPPPSTCRKPTGPVPRNADAALPSVVWWRGFRSKELTDLIEEALTSNFDVAAAVARIVQADAQSRIAGAALLPIVDLNADATRSVSSRTTGSRGVLGGVQSGGSSPSTDLCDCAQRELRDRFLGQEPRGVARHRGAGGREPLRPRGDRAHHRRHRGQLLLPGARRARSPAHRARQSRSRDPRVRSDQAALRRRHRVGARPRPAGKRGRPAARLDPAARADPAAEHCDARGADRPHARVGAVSAPAACRSLPSRR